LLLRAKPKNFSNPVLNFWEGTAKLLNCIKPAAAGIVIKFLKNLKKLFKHGKRKTIYPRAH